MKQARRASSGCSALKRRFTYFDFGTQDTEVFESKNVYLVTNMAWPHVSHMRYTEIR